MQKTTLLSLITTIALAYQPAQAVLIDNGISGDGFWQVDVLAGGESHTGNLDPAGSQVSTDVIYDYLHYVDVGADGNGFGLGSTTITTAPYLSGPNEVTSAGSFAGSNGPIFWTAVSSIASGSALYQTTLNFTSNADFGAVRLIQYLDEDVLGHTDDHLIVLGTPGGSNFQLLTIDNTDNVGVSHSAGYATALGMTYIGWAADQYSDLQDAITGTGASYSISGTVDTTSLPSIVDGRFSGSPAYGPRDITSAIAFDFDPNARSASVIFALGGLPSGRPVDPNPTTVPEPGSIALLGLGLVGLRLSRSMGKKSA